MSKEELERAGVEVEIAKANVSVAEKLFDNTLEGAERLIRSRNSYQYALSKQHSEFRFLIQEIAEWARVVASHESELCEVRQNAGKFVASLPASWGDDDGWSWPVRIIQAGWSQGRLEDRFGVPHCYSVDVVAQIAEAANGAKFRRRHPDMDGGAAEPGLTAGWMSDCKVSGAAAIGTINLLRNEVEIRSMLMAAREAGKLGLFGVSIHGNFGWGRSTHDGQPAVVTTRLEKLYGVDLVAEPGAGGRFLA